MHPPILQELERRENHRRWWVVFGLLTAFAGEEQALAALRPAADSLRRMEAGVGSRGCVSQTTPGRGTSLLLWVPSDETVPPVSSLYLRTLETDAVRAVQSCWARRRARRFDVDLVRFLACLLRAPTD